MVRNLRMVKRKRLLRLNYYAICFSTLLFRGTINAVAVICRRQAGRHAGPDWTGTLLIYGQNYLFPEMLRSVGGVPELEFLIHMAVIKNQK